jgi:hypothetical protein
MLEQCYRHDLDRQLVDKALQKKGAVLQATLFIFCLGADHETLELPTSTVNRLRPVSRDCNTFCNTKPT